MKTLNVFLIALIVLIFSCKTSDEDLPDPGDDPDPDKLGIVGRSSIPINKSAASYARDQGALVIAMKDPETGQYELRIDKLVKEFSDGTPVKYFGLRTNNADFGFIRIGQDANGNYKSEAFRSSQKNGKIRLIEIAEAVWYVTCSLSDCTFCTPNSDGTACECPELQGVDEEKEDKDLTFFDAYGNEIKIGREDYDGMMDCTFGAGVNNLYTNQVIY